MDSKLSRSVRLEKIGFVYKKYVEQKEKYTKPKKEHIKSTKTKKKRESKKLNNYQKFIQEESKKEKYKNLKPDERMKQIAKLWKRTKQ